MVWLVSKTEATSGEIEKDRRCPCVVGERAATEAAKGEV